MPQQEAGTLFHVISFQVSVCRHKKYNRIDRNSQGLEAGDLSSQEVNRISDESCIRVVHAEVEAHTAPALLHALKAFLHCCLCVDVANT